MLTHAEKYRNSFWIASKIGGLATPLFYYGKSGGLLQMEQWKEIDF